MGINKSTDKAFIGNFEYDGELKYRLIFEKSPIGIFQYNTDAVITECNDRFVEILMSKRELLVGFNMHSIRDKSIMPAILDALSGKHGFYEGPYQATTSNANVYIMLKTVPIHNQKDNSIVGALGIVEDVTERMKAQQELAKKEEHFRILSSLTTDAASILTIQPDGSFKRDWLSISLLSALGYKPEEIETFENWATIVHPDDLPIYLDGIEKIKNGQKVTIEIRVKAKDGHIFWIQNTVFPESDSQGKTIRLISAVKDITEKKNREQEIQQQRNLLKSIVDNAPIGIWVVRTDGSYPLINPYFAQNIGYGTPAFSMTQEEIEQCRRSDNLALNSDQPIETNEEVTFTDGKKHILRIFKQRLLSSTGQVTGVLGIAMDMTERFHYEKALIEALEKAEESDKLKSAFLANMSHEIRTPLNGVIGFAKFLRNFPDTTPQERDKFLGIISTSADHLLTLINDIIDISKIDVGQLTINPEPFNLNSLLSEIYTFFFNANPDLHKRGISFTYNTPLPDSEANIYSDKLRLRQVLTNLVGNALKFTPKGKIEFGYELLPTENVLKFYVSDTGIGIPKDKQEIIFHRFRQADANTTSQYGGTGLGLAICKSLVELMGGKIWVESGPDQGANFYFTMPLNLTQYSGTNNTEDYDYNSLTQLLKDKTILIAEDDPNSLYYLKTILQSFNVTILDTDNGQSAVEMVQANPNISLVILDLKMPVMNGYEAIKGIRSINPNVPILVQTAHAFSNERAIVQALGCNYFITNPIDINSLYLNMYRALVEQGK